MVIQTPVRPTPLRGCAARMRARVWAPRTLDRIQGGLRCTKTSRIVDLNVRIGVSEPTDTLLLELVLQDASTRLHCQSRCNRPRRPLTNCFSPARWSVRLAAEPGSLDHTDRRAETACETLFLNASRCNEMARHPKTGQAREGFCALPRVEQV